MRIELSYRAQLLAAEGVVAIAAAPTAALQLRGRLPLGKPMPLPLRWKRLLPTHAARMTTPRKE